LASYDSFTPLNKMVDAVPPESDRAREFRHLASLIAAGKASPEQWEQARTWLILWRDNDARLQPLLPRSDLTAELEPISRTLNQTGVIGLSALDSLQNHKPVSAAVRQQQLSFLKSAEAPQAVLLDMVVPSVELLLNATTP
jgi:hexosaminidase